MACPYCPVFASEEELIEYLIGGVLWFRKLNLKKNDLKFLKSLRKHLPKPKEKPKTIPSILKKPFDESFIKDFLAYIINPKLKCVGFNREKKRKNKF